MTVSREELEHTVVQTLEDAAFILAEPLTDSQAPVLEGEVLEARLTFAGKSSGCFVLRAPWAFGEEVAANLMGVDSGDRVAKDRALEAMAELLNIVGGNAVHSLFGDEEMIHLGVPEFRVVHENTGATPMVDLYRAALRAGDHGHTVDVALEVSRTEPPAAP